MSAILLIDSYKDRGKGDSLFSKEGKSFLKDIKCLRSMNSTNAPVAKENRQLNFGRFVTLEQCNTSKLGVFQNLQFFRRHIHVVCFV